MSSLRAVCCVPPYAGIAGAGAWLLGTWEVDRRSIDDMYHEGAIILLLQIICMVSTVIVYGWICDLVNYVRGNKPETQVCSAMCQARVHMMVHLLGQQTDKHVKDDD